MKNSLAENIKISKNFLAEFLRLVDETEKKGNFELLSRENTLKRKSKKKNKNKMESANLKRLSRFDKREEKRLRNGQL